MITHNIKYLILSLFILTFSIISLHVNAVTPTPTPEQIAQFQKMSPEQQKLIAKQFGFDLDFIQGNLQQSTSQEVAPVVTPREVVYSKTQNDENTTGKEDEPLKPFGYDLFAGEPTSFSPVTDIPIPSEYIIGPGDELIIQLYGKQNDIFRLTVSRNGEIQFPELGPISIANLSFDNAKKLLKKRVKNQIIGVESSISLGGLRSMRVFVLGDTYRPGSYEVSSLSTITNALFVSGGIKTIGSLRNIQLKRHGKLITTLDLYDLLLNGDTSSDLRLLPGDVVFIPSVGGRVQVDGEVMRPAIYEIKKNETLKKLLKMVGGLKPTANAKTVLLSRVNKQHVREVIDVDLTSAKSTSLQLFDGDTLKVGVISDYVQSAIKLSGAITRDGLYAWKKGMRLSNIVKNLKTDVKINADLAYSIVVREINIQGDIKVIQFSLGEMILNQGDEKIDLELQANDEIIIFSKSSRKKLLTPIFKKLKQQKTTDAPYQVVYLVGEVKFPGAYPLIDSANIKQLLVAGGGLKDSAYTLSAEISRTSAEVGESVKIKHFQIDLAGIMQSQSSENIPLQSRDTVTVRIKPAWSKTTRVTIKGEVKFPGRYVVERGETLSQLLQRAGGVTERSYPKGAVFLREELRKREQELIKKMREQLKASLAAEAIGEQITSSVEKDKTLKLVDELDETQMLGRLVIDLPAIIKKSTEFDLILKNGDKLVIPMNSQTLTVIGQVQQPTSHIFNKQFTVEEYIRKSGGMTEQADNEKVYIIKANGSVVIPNNSNWFVSSDSYLEAGDTIVIPLDTAYIKPLTLWSTVTTIIYQTAVALAAIGSL